ncbi:CLUMA_CG003325, isoform A [Clunio marinus]|uniref:CLUMA_CG003325, isoform A n=1 Tax=Clunio marinus TaxID=568069 RepID=A0A1J1HQF9_9DIPT|nr:CLUMA_CG003325, isoform A [Clunio marinus]
MQKFLQTESTEEAFTLSDVIFCLQVSIALKLHSSVNFLHLIVALTLNLDLNLQNQLYQCRLQVQAHVFAQHAQVLVMQSHIQEHMADCLELRFLRKINELRYVHFLVGKVY